MYIDIKYAFFFEQKAYDILLLSKLKSDCHLPKKLFYGSPSKMMKNAFYFILKAPFVLKIFKFLYCLFGHVKKGLIRKVRLIWKFMTS